MLTFVSLNLRAQSYYFKSYNVEDGLPFIKVNSIAQAPDGTLWLGGYAGIARYDGLSFKSPRLKNEIIHSNVSVLRSDGESIWVGTTKGVSRIINDTAINFDVSNGLSELQVRDIVVSIKGVHIIHPNSITVFRKGVPVDTIKAVKGEKFRVATWHRGTLWIGSDRGLLKMNDADSLAPVSFSSQFRARVHAFEVVGDKLYFGSDHGLHSTKNGDTFDTFGVKEGLLGSAVSEIIQKDSNALWVSTELGLNQIKNNEVSLLFVSDHPGSNQVKTFFSDYENNTWIGTDFGLYKSVGNAFEHFSYKDGLRSNFIYGIDSDLKGDIWLATESEGLYKYNGRNFTGYSVYHGLPNNKVRSVYSRGDSLLIGTMNGFVIRENGVFKQVKNGRIPAYSIRDIDGYGILIGSESGIARFENDSISWLYRDSANSYNVWDIVKTGDSTLWIGTYEGGLLQYKNGELIDGNAASGVPFSQHIAIAKDYKENLWISSFDGVYHYDIKNQKVRRFSTDHGLSSNLIYTLEIDETNNLWIGSNQGVNKIDLEDYYQFDRIHFAAYGINEGFVGVESNANGLFIDENQNVWLGTVNGLMRLDPSRLQQNQKEPRLHITAIELFYTDTNLLDGVHLPHDQNTISFQYNGISLTNPEKVRYRIKLEGYSEWSPVTDKREATYNNLPPGDYTFKVLSSNNAGVWNEEPETFSFTIEKPFWQTTWFRIAGVGFVLLLLFTFYQLRVNKIKRQSDLERKLDNLKLQALRSQMNPHFIFNSMNSIQHFINSNEKREANYYLTRFASLMRKTLENSRQTAISLESDLEALKLYIQLEQLRFPNKFDFELNIDKGVDSRQTLIPPILIQPFVENAVIHAFKDVEYKGVIKVSLKKDKGNLVCIIEDNGIGLSEASKKQVHSTHKSAAMDIMNERVDTLSVLYKTKLDIEVVDLKDQGSLGTRIILKIPVIDHENPNMHIS
ncbi:sensor histidine kinase [Salibacter halophilus]|uniref:Signal transduction histidine kinase internal region domain-containing protein n=1 Tax=Salibacter halophilus TaxID=1803916 RepID=A0A6N6M6D2_9FLAO|nr:sensor histidine kinase [Salibacter halophilus]KAB1063812.1 hypothetical protein F3059_09595 [Salibacter halophilus]